MAGNIKGIIVEIGGDTSGLQKALKNVNSATSSLSKELRGVNSLLKLDPTNTELVAQKQTLLSKNIEETSEKLKLLKEIQEQADSAIANGTKISEENYRALQREIANTENKLKTLQAQSSKWTTAGKAIEEFGNKITDVSDKVDKLGNTLTTSLTVPIASLGTAAVITGNNFEAQMSRVQAIAGATEEELAKLTEQAMQLGAETSFSATEVAAGMENLASAGFTTEEIMEAMPGLLDLAASSGAELATASEIAASAIRGFGLEASEAGHIADVFAEASARTNAQVEDMGNAMKYIAPVANTMGLKIEEVAAAIGIMSDAGIKGEQAGTTLRGALTRLTKPTDKMIGVMNELGISFYDNEGKMKSLTEMVKMLQDATKDLSDEQEQNALTTLFGTESLSGMVALINRGSDDLKDMTKSFKKADGAAEDMADTMLDNTAGSLESLSGSIESAGIAIQKALSPEIRDLSKWIQDLVDDFNDLSEEEQLNIIKTLALVAGVGPLIKILGTAGKTFGSVTKGIGLFSQALLVANNHTTSNVKSVNDLAKALTAIKSPVGTFSLILAGTVGIAAVLSQEQYAYAEAINTSSKKMQEAIEKQNEFRSSQDEILNSTLTEADNVQRLSNELQTLVDKNGKIKEGYEGRVSFILNELNGALGTEYKLNGEIVDSYDEIIKSIDNLIQKKRINAILENEEAKYNEAMSNKTKAYDDMIAKEEELANAKNEVLEAQEKLNNLDKNRYPLLKTSYENELRMAQNAQAQAEENLNNSKNLYHTYLDDIATYQNDYEIAMSGSTEKIKELINSKTYTYQQSSNDIGEVINHNIQQVQYELEQYKLARAEDLKNQDEMNAKKNQAQIEAGETQLKNLAQQLMDMTSTTEELTPQQTEAWKNLATSSYDVYKEYINKMTPEMQGEIQEITGVIVNDKTVKKATKELAKDAEEGFNNNVDGAEWGNDLTKEMSEGMTSNQSKNWIVSAASTVADWISSFLHFSVPEKGPLSDMDKSMPDMIELMAKGIYSNKHKLIEATEKLSRDLKDKLILNGSLNLGNIESMQGNVISKTIDSNKAIYTTPQIVFNVQELDEAKLEQCFNYINRKFGSQY